MLMIVLYGKSARSCRRFPFSRTVISLCVYVPRPQTPVRNETKPSSVDDNDGDDEDDEGDGDYPEDGNDNDADDSNNEDEGFSLSAISPSSSVMSSSTPGNASFSPAYDNNVSCRIVANFVIFWSPLSFALIVYAYVGRYRSV